MRIALVISGLGPGGAERVMSLLAGAFADRGHEVWLITLAAEANDFFVVDPRVRRVGLALMADSGGVSDALRANLRRLRALRRAVSGIKPHVVLSFVTPTNVLAILACTRLPPRVVVSERVDPVSHREQRLWAVLRTLVYHRADAVVVQTEAAAQWFRKWLGKGPPVSVIPNPVVLISELRRSPLQVPKPFMLAAGRLVPQKGFDVLIRAFALAAPECGQLRLAIAGDGPAAQALRDLVAELRLENRVLFLGNVRELQTLMSQAEGFILSSRYEGFPNVLLEALASGLPVVATDCPNGPREILRDGDFGLLVPCDDPTALAGALRRLATDTMLRSRLAACAPGAIERYSLAHVVDEWEALLEQRQTAGS
jgi:GalNAc-alpha-(1->4)-GalNAc-alpha-(1->3)-diNAcBac-PP-undecaprenol alpha-1,4-N-acetyl-D-galactosaminyltransferase